MPGNLKPKADEAENEAGNCGGEAEERRKRPKGSGRKKLRGRPEPEREGKRCGEPL